MKKNNGKTSYRKGKLKTVFMLTAVCLVIVMSVSACRPSTVLVEEIYKSVENEIDEEQQQLDPEDEGEEDERFQNEERDYADTERNVEENLGQSDTDGSADNSVQMNQNENADSSEGSSGGSSDTASSSVEGSGDGSDSDTDSTEVSSGESDVQGNDDDGTGESSTGEGGGDSGTYATFKMEDARQVDIYVPENIEHVAAVGGAAQFVEMIGGPGKLYFTDSELKSSSIANSVFSDLSDAKAIFSGTSCKDFDALVEAIEESTLDVIFIISGDERLTSEERSILDGYAYTGDEDKDSDGAHVAVIYLYSMYTLDGLKGNAALMDTVFSKSDIADAPSTGAAYVNWVEGIENEVSGYSAEKAGLYIAGWDSDATWTLLNGSQYGFESFGTGVAYAYTSQKTDQILTELMEKAGVANSSIGGSPGKNLLWKSYVVSDYAYAAPLFQRLEGTISGGRADAHYYDYVHEKKAYNYQEIVTEGHEPFVQLFITGTTYYSLGTSYFPAIVVADNDTKKQIEQSPFWEYYEESTSGRINPYGTTVDLYQIILGEYEIYVNPAGMLNWCEGGSVEAPLEMLFIAYAYQGGDEIDGDVAEFYSTFFGCDSSKASDIAKTIMKGN